tara:strand:+ start:299 stop:445 length:147 start_codon:yes stop_codon:yes gene_type:complete
MNVRFYGAKRIRTADLLHAMQALYQLSYGPTFLKQFYQQISGFNQQLL